VGVHRTNSRFDSRQQIRSDTLRRTVFNNQPQQPTTTATNLDGQNGEREEEGGGRDARRSIAPQQGTAGRCGVRQ